MLLRSYQTQRLQKNGKRSVATVQITDMWRSVKIGKAAVPAGSHTLYIGIGNAIHKTLTSKVFIWLRFETTTSHFLLFIRSIKKIRRTSRFRWDSSLSCNWTIPKVFALRCCFPRNPRNFETATAFCVVSKSISFLWLSLEPPSMNWKLTAEIKLLWNIRILLANAGNFFKG